MPRKNLELKYLCKALFQPHFYPQHALKRLSEVRSTRADPRRPQQGLCQHPPHLSPKPGILRALGSLFFTSHPSLAPQSFLKTQGISHPASGVPLHVNGTEIQGPKVQPSVPCKEPFPAVPLKFRNSQFMGGEKRTTAPVQQPPASHSGIKFH